MALLPGPSIMRDDAFGGEASVETSALVLPAGDAETGGDFHLVDRVGHRTLAFVGDVEGNGAEATPYADHVCAELKRMVDDADPVTLLEQLNSMIYDDAGFDRFVTACAVVIDHIKWSAEWAFAGHLPPHWLDSGLPLDGATPGFPLGVQPACGAASAQRRPLRSGEGMLLFTDGLEDVRGPGGDRFGAARITHTLASRLHGAAPEAVVTTLREVACEFGHRQLADDLCLVAMRIT
jgi:serine phosphatase RsbU (regulator of sigma subunit)